MFSREADTFTLGVFKCGSFDGSTSGDWNDTDTPSRVTLVCRLTNVHFAARVGALMPQPQWSLAAILRRALFHPGTQYSTGW